MYNIKEKNAFKIEPVSFNDIGMQENDIEEILRENIDLICDDEESMLIVGRQVKNEMLGRSDLTASEMNNWYCDDCLSELLKIEPRQTVNATCNTIYKADKIKREKTVCFNCKKLKLSNSIKHDKIST